MTLAVWIFGDLPRRQAAGPSYMVESWQRELTRLGMRPRTFTPAAPGHPATRTADAVTFRSLRHIGYPGDHHARYSAVAQLARTHRELPDVVVVSTLGRVGVLGLIIASARRVPLVMVVSTDTTGATAYYNAARALASGGVKPLVLSMASRRARVAFRRRPAGEEDRADWRRQVVARTTAALHADAAEIVLLSTKGLATYGRLNAEAGLTVVPAGVDRLPERAGAPAGPVWPDGALRVLYVGRLAPEKNLSLLVQALRLAVDDGLDVHLALVGEGPSRAQLLAEADRLGVGDRLSVAGPYPRVELGGVYAPADVFAFPSVVDTQAFVLNEAAHEGLPLLVSDTANGVVADEVSALVVPPEPAQYAAALARLTDPQLRARLGAAARERAVQVGEAAQSARLAEVIRRAAAHPRRAPAPVRSTPLPPVWVEQMSDPVGSRADGPVSGAAPTR